MSLSKGKPLVFVVDDEPIISSTIAMILECKGFDAKSFTNPIKALAAACLQAPDLLISDVVMPELSGVDPLCANMSDTSRPSTITVGRGKKSHFDEHKQDKHFLRCVGSFGAYRRSWQCSGRPSVDRPAASRF